MAKVETANRLNGEANGGAGEAAHGAFRSLAVSPPNLACVPVRIRGIAPLVINAFPRKAREAMRDAQMAGSQAKKGKKREPKDFDLCFEEAKHVSTEGWCGIAAAAFRQGMISACRLVGFKMTHAKLGVWVQADGFDRQDGTALVRILAGEPRKVEHPVINASGVADIRSRPMWDPGWEAVVQVEFDQDMFTAGDVLNLMARVGRQVGVGEGRPSSKNSAGQGWGLFELVVGEMTIDERQTTA